LIKKAKVIPEVTSKISVTKKNFLLKYDGNIFGERKTIEKNRYRLNLPDIHRKNQLRQKIIDTNTSNTRLPYLQRFH